ncbi:Retrovirus-related Pol polyprotein from type-1 retrotransposable element R1 [Eumeta japonica]|uniref:Retrovirus-related Pol polyprotein from type-1 retrotransposable element R1 n=1 Tax=Eumeta variegata TaxID=151549 RepID=A0A4C1UB31_EUMVA|nr:Retrovirus-related Pol polyprotein from type-1 retrotransposable element R1 [Eumeta japonica]
MGAPAVRCELRHRLWAWPVWLSCDVTEARRPLSAAVAVLRTITGKLYRSSLAMVDKDKDEAAIFMPRQSICRTPPSGRRDTEVSEQPVAECTESAFWLSGNRLSGKKELLGRAHEAVRAIFGIVAGPGSKINKADTNSVASHGHDILAVVAALNLKLAEAELAVASAKLEAAKAISTGIVQAPATTTMSYAATLKLPGPKRAVPERKKPSGGPVLAFYPVAEQSEAIKSAEETKKVLKSAMDPTSMQVQVSKVRKVGRAGVIVETTSVEAAEKLKKAVPPTLKVTEPRSRKPLVALRNLLGDPSGEAVITALYEQNMRIKYPDWSLDRLKKSCRVAFKKSRREGSTTTVVLECEPELREVLVTLDRAYIGWEAVPICETVCGKCGATGHRLADCQSTVTRCATCHRFGRREGETHTTASRDCPARRFAEERKISVTRYGRLGLGVVMVQEQYSGAPNILQTDTESSAGILIVRNDLAVSILTHLSNSHCLVCHVEPLDIHIISCYFQYSDSIDKHLDHLERVPNILRGRRILIGVDCNAHSPLWFCEQRQYTGRGPDTEYRRQRIEGFVFGRGLYLHNVEGQPATFAGPSGESNIDLTLSTRNLGVADWKVHDGISSSDHRLITCRVSSTVESAARAQLAEEPVRFRDR